MTHIPGRIIEVERADDYVVVSINNVGDDIVRIRITGIDADALWAAGEYWDALKEQGEQLRSDLEDEMRDMGVWQDDDEDEN